MGLTIPDDQKRFYPAPLSCRAEFTRTHPSLMNSMNCLNYALDYWDYGWVRPDSFPPWIETDERVVWRKKLTADFAAVSPQWRDVLDFDPERIRRDEFYRDCIGVGLIPVRRPVTADGYRLIAHVQDKEFLKRHIESLGMTGKDAHWLRLDNDGSWSHKYGDGPIAAFASRSGRAVRYPHEELTEQDEDHFCIFEQYYLAPVAIHKTSPVPRPFHCSPVPLT